MTLEEKGKKILDTLVEIRKKRVEQEKLYAELEFQAILMLQGIDSQQVVGMGFDPSKVKKSMRLRYYADGKIKKGYINGFIMKDGTKIILERPIKL